MRSGKLKRVWGSWSTHTSQLVRFEELVKVHLPYCLRKCLWQSCWVRFPVRLDSGKRQKFVYTDINIYHISIYFCVPIYINIDIYVCVYIHYHLCFLQRGRNIYIYIQISIHMYRYINTSIPKNVYINVFTYIQKSMYVYARVDI